MKKKFHILMFVFFISGLNCLIAAPDPSPTKENNAGVNKIGLRILNSQIKKNIPRKFIFDDLNFSFLTGIGVDVLNLRMSENPAFKDHPLRTSPYFYRSKNTQVKVKFLPLLIAKVHMRSMDITQPRIQLLRNKEGTFSVEDLFQEQREGPVLDWLNVDDMTITGGRLNYYDTSMPRSPLKLSFKELDTMVSGFSLNRDFKVIISMKGPGANEKNIFFNGKAGPIKDAENFQEVPMDMDFRMFNEPLVPFVPMIPPGIPAPISGTLHVDYHVKGNFWSGLDMKGEFLAQNMILSTEGSKVKSIPFLVKVSSGDEMKIISKDQIFSIKNGLIKLNKTDFHINGTFRDYKENPTLDAEFYSPAIDLEDFKNIHPFHEKYMPQGMHYSGFCKARIHVKGTRENVVLSAELDLTDTVYDVPDFFAKKPATHQKFDFKATINPKTISIFSEGSIESGEILFAAPDIIETIQSEFLSGLKNNIREVSILNLNKGKPLRIEKLEGKINYHDAIMTVMDLKLSNCHQENTERIDATVNGTVDINNEIVDITGDLRLSSHDSQKLIKTDSFYSDVRLDDDGRLVIPIKITGTLKAPVIQFRNNIAQAKEGTFQP